MEQEKLAEIANIEQLARQLEANLQMIETEIVELENFKITLKTIVDSKQTEMLSSLGKRVYIKTDIKDIDNLFVEVGAGVVVKKSPKDSLKIAEEQISKLNEARLQISHQLEAYQRELDSFIQQMNSGA